MDIIVYLKSSVDFEIIALFIIMIVEIFYQPYAAYVMLIACLTEILVLTVYPSYELVKLSDL